MLAGFNRRAEFRERVARANEFMARHGEYAYAIARDYRIQALTLVSAMSTVLSQVSKVIASNETRGGPDTDALL